MPDHTENHEYQLFVNDELPWEHRTDFEALDANVEIRDEDANWSAYEAKEGAMYHAIDIGAIYFGDGSSWVKADLDAATVNVA